MEKAKVITGSCVVCGRPLYAGPSGLTARHECPKRVLGARQAAQTRAERYGTAGPLNPTWGQRLSEGFQMMDEAHR